MTGKDSGPEKSGLRHAVALSEAVEGALSFQQYAEPNRIHDVLVSPIKKHRSGNGWFAEVAKLDGGGRTKVGTAGDLAVRQLSASYAEPRRLNAFHIHPREAQNELWTVLTGSLLVWLIDCRLDSPSEGIKQRIVLSGEEPSQLYIPAGVAHGYRAGPHGALLLYVMDQQFDRQRPNEGRLPWDYFGRELWDEDKG